MDYTTAFNLQIALRNSGYTCTIVNTNFSSLSTTEQTKLYPGSFALAVKSEDLSGVKRATKRHSSASFSFYFFASEAWAGHAYAGHIKIS